MRTAFAVFVVVTGLGCGFSPSARAGECDLAVRGPAPVPARLGEKVAAEGFAFEPSASTELEIVARASRETVRVGADYVVVPVVRFSVVVRFADRRELVLGGFVRSAAGASEGVYETALALLPDCAGLRLLEGRDAGTAATARAEFGAAVDEYRYRLTVEWDQRDLGRRAEIVREFESRVKGLFATGLETDDAFAVLADRTDDPAFAKDLRAFREANVRRPFDRARVLGIVRDYASPERGWPEDRVRKDPF